jgi:hypothetical protein
MRCPPEPSPSAGREDCQPPHSRECSCLQERRLADRSKCEQWNERRTDTERPPSPKPGRARLSQALTRSVTDIGAIELTYAHDLAAVTEHSLEALQLGLAPRLPIGEATGRELRCDSRFTANQAANRLEWVPSPGWSARPHPTPMLARRDASHGRSSSSTFEPQELLPRRGPKASIGAGESLTPGPVLRAEARRGRSAGCRGWRPRRRRAR